MSLKLCWFDMDMMLRIALFSSLAGADLLMVGVRELFCCLMCALNELNAECAIARGPLNTSQKLLLHPLLH